MQHVTLSNLNFEAVKTQAFINNLTQINVLQQQGEKIKNAPAINEILILSDDLLLQLDNLPCLNEKSITLEQLRQKLTQQINDFKIRLKKKGRSNTTCLAACYLLCCALDEAILKSEWNKKHNWRQNSLLNFFYYDTNGGETFFVILEILSKCPSAHIELLEFSYVLISLGFIGRYKLRQEAGQHELERTRQKLFEMVRLQRDLITKKLFNQYLPPPKKKFKQLKIYRWLVSLFISSCIIYGGFYLILSHEARPLMHKFNLMSEQLLIQGGVHP